MEFHRSQQPLNVDDNQKVQPRHGKVGGHLFPEGCGGLAFTTKSATLYAVSLNGPTQPSTQLRSLPNGGLTDQWALADPG